MTNAPFFSLFALLLVWSLAGPADAQTSLSVDPAREVIVAFEPGAVERPPGHTRGSLETFGITAPSVEQALTDAGTEHLAQLIPGFEPENRFATSRTGIPVELTDWTHTYVVRVASRFERDALMEALNVDPAVRWAEPNQRIVDAAGIAPPLPERAWEHQHDSPLVRGSARLLIPNDPEFRRQWGFYNTGNAQYQGGGAEDADADISEAWEYTTGSGSAVVLGVLERGVTEEHPDFAGRVDLVGLVSFPREHGTAVTGVLAAQGNNDVGIAGVVWDVPVKWASHEDDAADGAAAIYALGNAGVDVINSSWSVEDHSVALGFAVADAYQLGITFVSAMGNSDPEETENQAVWPARHRQPLISVGATTNTDDHAAYSNTGFWIDVAAPGGAYPETQAQSDEDYIYTTVGTGYSYYIGGQPLWGTSFATPIVSGIAGLLLAEDPSLLPDDIAYIIRETAEDVNDDTDPGFDNKLGAGRVNAEQALELIQAPNELVRLSASGGWTHSVSSLYNQGFFTSGLNGTFLVKRYEMR